MRYGLRVNIRHFIRFRSGSSDTGTRVDLDPPLPLFSCVRPSHHWWEPILGLGQWITEELLCVTEPERGDSRCDHGRKKVGLPRID